MKIEGWERVDDSLSVGEILEKWEVNKIVENGESYKLLE